jgi:hypothetical protein
LATTAPEQEFIGAGTKLDDVGNGAFYQNLWTRNGLLEVRPGFGQLAQLDTTLAFPPKAWIGGDTEWQFGFQEVCATHAFTTSFGHDQLLVLVALQASDSDGAFGGQFRRTFSLLVYDLTTGRHIESPLMAHTSQAPKDLLIYQRGGYQTHRTADFASYAQNPTSLSYGENPEIHDDHGCWFTNYGDNVIFGSPAFGLWCYRPIDVSSWKWRQLDNIRNKDQIVGEAEDSWCIPVIPQPGIFQGRFAYATGGVFPSKADAGCSLGLRFAVAQGREIFISDVDRPGSVMAVNVLSVPCVGNITALAEVRGLLMIWTHTQTWVLNPSESANVAAGDLRQLSATVGCVGQQAVASVDGSAVWLDANGVWLANGVSEPVGIADDIEPFFDAGVSMPVSSFYQNQGLTTASDLQPRVRIRGGDWRGASVRWLADPKSLVVSVPSQSIALVRQGSVWSVWTTESVVAGAETSVGVLALRAPHISTLRDRMFITGGMDAYPVDDQTIIGGEGASASMNDEPRSLWIGELGRGGGVDRTVASDEDNRVAQGWYEWIENDASNAGFFLIDKPFKLAEGYPYLPRTPSPAIGENEVWLFPIGVYTVDQFPSKIVLHIDFDNTQWQPVFFGATPEINFDLPPERTASAGGWGYGVPAPGSQVRCYDPGGAVYSQNGRRLVLEFDGSVGVAWSHQPNMNVTPGAISPLLYIPMRKLSPSDDTMSQGFDLVTATIEDGVVPAPVDINLVVWHHAVFTKNGADSTAQAIDWMLRSERLESEQYFQARVRNVYLRAVASGDAAVPVTPTWPRRTLNVTAAPDDKDWSAQIVDHAGAIATLAHAPLRARFMVAPDDTPSRQEVGSSAATPPKWGDGADTATGNLLSSDPAVDTYAISLRARGEFVSVSLWGHMTNFAEWLFLRSGKAAIQRISGRRRRGR